MESQSEESDGKRHRSEPPRRGIVWMEWSWRLFIATWPGVFALTSAFLVWVATSIFRHEQRIANLESGMVKDLERVRLQILSEVETRASARFDTVLAEIRELQRSVLTLKIRDDITREQREKEREK